MDGLQVLKIKINHSDPVRAFYIKISVPALTGATPDLVELLVVCAANLLNDSDDS